MGWNDRPYPLLPLGDSQPYTYTRPYDYSHPIGRLEERESYPFATRLIGRPHLAYLR